MSLSFIKKNLLISAISFLVVVILLSLILVSFFSTHQAPLTPPINSLDKPQGGESYTTVNDKVKQQIQKDDLVGKLIDKLPYQGQNVKLVYTISNNHFTATFKNATRATGEQELKDFLKQNQIENTDWLYNFTVKTE